MRKKIKIGLICQICLICCAAQAEEISLTLDDAVMLALRDNRDILLKAEDVKKAFYTLLLAGDFARRGR